MVGDRERPAHNSREVDVKSSSPRVGQEHGIVAAQVRKRLPRGPTSSSLNCCYMVRCVCRGNALVCCHALTGFLAAVGAGLNPNKCPMA